MMAWVNRRSTDLHTRIAELGVVLHHCEFFFFTFFTQFYSRKKGENIFFSNFFSKMFFEKLNYFLGQCPAENVDLETLFLDPKKKKK